MLLLKLVFISAFCFNFFFCQELYNVVENEKYLPQISAVLNYLNANPNKVYQYNKGLLISAQNKADIVEITAAVDVVCINKFPEVPCNDGVQNCHAFVSQNPNESGIYQVLGDAKCSPRIDISIDTEEAKGVPPVLFENDPLVENSKIELSNEAVSKEQGSADFVAYRRGTVPCLGCPFDLDTNAEGVDELIDTAVKHIESERDRRHKVVNVKRLQQQVVAGVKYILLAEVAPTNCLKDADLSSPCPLDLTVEPLICDVTFIEKPWISKAKHIIKNNCTISQEFAPIKISRNERDDIDNEVPQNGDIDIETPDKPTPAVPNYDGMAHSGNMEMDQARLADLESQIIVDMLEDPIVSKVETQPKTSPPSFIQQEYVAVDEVPPVTKDIENLNVEPLNKDVIEPLPFNSIPMVDEQEPIITMYDYQEEPLPVLSENKIIKSQEFSDDALERNRRANKNGDNDSSSSSSSEENNNNEEDNNKNDIKKEKCNSYFTCKYMSEKDADNKNGENNESSSSSSSSDEDNRNKRSVDEVANESNSSSDENNVEIKENKQHQQVKPQVSESDSNSQEEVKNRKKRSAAPNNESDSNSNESNEPVKKNKGELNVDSSSEEDAKLAHNQKSKRSIGQMEKISSDEKVIVRDLADFAAETLDDLDTDHHKGVILQILGAKKLKLDGIYYQIILRLGISHCHEGQHNENCREKLFTNLTKICKVQVHVQDDYSNRKLVKSQCQNIKKDEHDRNRTNYSRYRRQVGGLAGGHSPLPVDNPDVKKFVKATLLHLDSNSKHENKHKSVEVLSATSQVVAGLRYIIKAKIGLSKCKKSENIEPETCDLLEGAEPEICTIDVWERSWLNKRQYTVKCSENKYNFVSTSERRRKRQLIGGVDEDISIEHPEAREFILKALNYLSTKIPTSGKYELQKINKVTKQIVAGTRWNIEADIALCEQIELLRTTRSMCPDESKHTTCQFTVHNQPWLVDGLRISFTCENDENIYTYEPLMEFNGQLNSYNFDVDKAFGQFAKKYNKLYRDDDEYRFRLKVFRDNLNKIALLNKYEKGTAVYSITQFADLTEKEFSKRHGYRPDLIQENELPFAHAKIPDLELPKAFDWRTKGAVTEVKNQGMCGSCWAFSVTGNVEGQYAIKYGKLLEFSEQELVDCDKVDEGCNGGLMDNAYRVIEKLGGLESESDYPYEAEDEKCHFNPSKVKVELSGALNISHNETDMAKWLVQNGPISIAINANAMQFYVGGVSHPWKMLCNPNNLDHGVLIVGYGVHKYSLFNKTLPYWIVKNSWGESWGEQGYYRVFRGDGTCGLNQTPSSAIVA